MFRVETIQGIKVVTLDIHALDATNVAGVARHVATVLGDGQPAVVDLGALRYFDVRGFAAMLKWVAIGSATPDREVRLCSSAGTVHALFELLDGQRVMAMHESRDDALAFLATPSPESQPQEGNTVVRSGMY